MHALHGHEDHDELVEFLIEQGHSEERAQQIAGNHPDAVRADVHAEALRQIAREESATVPDPSER
jgi:hypothetical protein